MSAEAAGFVVRSTHKPTAWDLEAELMFAISELESLPEGQEPSEEIQALVFSCMEAAVEKRDALAGAYKRKQAEITVLDERAKDAIAKARAVENSLKRLNDYILKILDMRGEKQIRGEQYRIGWQKNPDRVEVTEDFLKAHVGSAGHDRYVRFIPVAYEPDKHAIKSALNSGELVACAHLVEGSRRVVIR